MLSRFRHYVPEPLRSPAFTSSKPNSEEANQFGGDEMLTVSRTRSPPLYLRCRTHFGFRGLVGRIYNMAIPSTMFFRCVPYRLAGYKRELLLSRILRSCNLPRPDSKYYSTKMTSTHTGGACSTSHKHADPYKEKNLDLDTNLKEKVEGLVSFAEGLKFGLMTTRQNESGMLVSRCMAVAARVLLYFSSKDTVQDTDGFGTVGRRH